MSIHVLLASGASRAPLSTALLGCARAPLSYADLLVQVEQTAKQLSQSGITPGDRVALVLPNGPESAVACFAIAAVATCAPLNPAYSNAEFEFYFSDLKPKALVLPRNLAPPAEAAALKLGVPVIYLRTDPAQPAGTFHLDADLSQELPFSPRFAGSDDVALVLHTSGSTARPKIVPLTHANLCASASNIAASLSLDPSDRCLNIMPLFHIHGLIGAVLSSWTAGASVAAMPGLQAPQFFDWVKEFQPTWYTAVPAMHQSIVMRARQLSSVRGTSLRFARSCSSALAPKLLAEVEDALGIPLVEAYGMTEASHQMASNPLPPATRKPGSVGLAAGCGVAIMDGSGALLGPEEIGEVVIRGGNVTGGYENNPEANETSFSSGWFRTGDQGRMDREGYLFLTGRSKEIINRGGEKISPREIDEVLAEHPAVLGVVAFALPDSRLGEDVGAAVVLKENLTVSAGELREFASRRLADFKIPRTIVFLPELPKGPTGKILRIGLAQKLGLEAAEEHEPETFAEPVTDTERNVAEIWREVLEVPRVGLRDDFFALGGDSILAARVLVRLRERLGADIPLFELFGSPDLSDFCRVVEAAPRSGSEPGSTIPVVPRGGLLPLSPAQRRMWFLNRFEDSVSAYCIPVALRVRGPLDADVLRRSMERIITRHEILRTRYVAIDGTPFQQILPPSTFELPVELDRTPEIERPARAEQLAYEETHRPWNLAVHSPLRARLIRFDPEDHLLLLVIHHIASDGWSKSVLFRDLEACYAAERSGTEPSLPLLPIQFVDFAQWQLASLASPATRELASFWTRQLEGVPALLDLPLDRPRPARQMFDGSVVRTTLPASLRDELTQMGRKESATLHMTLLAGLAAVLYRYSGQQEFCVGVPAAGRRWAESENLIGPFLNILPIPMHVSADQRFKDLLAKIRQDSLQAHAYEEFPLERVIEAVQPQRSLSYSPLFQVLFQLRNFPEINTRLEGLQVEPIRFDSGTAQVDLSLEATETSEGVDLCLTYNTALFDRPTAEAILTHYQVLLEAAVKDAGTRVENLPLLSGCERAQLLSDWNQTAAEYPAESTLALFEHQAARVPTSLAVRGDDGSFNYGELDQRADAVASHLRHLGVQRGAVVAICVERSAAMLAGLLGIWKAGAAYVPLDPSYPRQRLQFILEDSAAQVIVSEPAHEAMFRDSKIPVLRLEATQNRVAGAFTPNAPGPEDLAYLLYTSGSTGKPKGVPIRHKSLVNTLCSTGKWFEFTASERVLALTTISFDISCLELFLPLVTGAEVIIGSRGLSGDGARLSLEIERTQATLVQATPATWQVLLDSGWKVRPGLKIVSGGEPLPKHLAMSLSRNASVWNLYGPTETTIYSTGTRIREDDERITIGKPLDNTQAYVLDATLQPVPIGVAGELYLGGDGLSPGYWRRPDLTAERFVPNPFSSDADAPLYRTGDLVRYRPGGKIEFLRRADNQVKLRGFRIELEEVESAVQTHPGIRSAAVAILQQGTPEARLTLFYIATLGNPPSVVGRFVDDLRRHLKEILPGYMIPSLFVPVDAFPRSPSGKIDRAALVASMEHKVLPMHEAAYDSEASENPAATTVAAPLERSMTEELLIEIWEDVLGRPVGRDDDFFALGGHSLLAARLVGRVESAFGTGLTLSAFFEAPTVAQMLALLGPGARAAYSKVIPIRSGSGTPLYVLHPSPFFRSLYSAMPAQARVLAVSVPAPSAAGHRLNLEQTAARQLEAIRESQPNGPVVLLGWCADGVLALEMAQQMRRSGQCPPLVVLVDAFAPRIWRRNTGRETLWNRLCHQVARGVFQASNLQWGKLESKGLLKRCWSLSRAEQEQGSLESSSVALVKAAWAYQPSPYPGPVLMFRAKNRPRGASADSGRFWGEILPSMEVVDIPGNHIEMLQEPNVQIIARLVSQRLGWVSDSGEELLRLSEAIDQYAGEVAELARFE